MKSRLTHLALLLLAIGCSKSDVETLTTSCVISKVEYTSYFPSGDIFTMSITNFKYDNSGRLMRIELPNISYVFEYHWEAGLVESVKLNGNEYEDWIYTDGKLSKINPAGSPFQFDVGLNAEGQPIKVHDWEYTYDTNGNVLTERHIGSSTIYHQFSDYDTNPNPGKLLAASVNLSFFPWQANAGVFSRTGAIYGKNNHRQRSEPTGGPRSVAYTYHANGQVATITESVSGTVYQIYIFSYLNC